MHHGIPFYVAAPLTSIDLSLSSGQEIVIEERSPKELLHTRGGLGEQVAASGISVWNPAFDVTPANLISGIITEKVSNCISAFVSHCSIYPYTCTVYICVLITPCFLCSGKYQITTQMIKLTSDNYLNRVSSRRRGRTHLILLSLCARHLEIGDAGFIKKKFNWYFLTLLNSSHHTGSYQ